MTTQLKISEIVGEGYRQFWNFKGRYLVVKGSRGSKKSTTTALKLVYLIMKQPLSNALVVRQTYNSLKDSCWVQLQWAADKLGVSHLWKFTSSPLEATYTPTGQKILFRGMDDPMKITSITVPRGFLNYVWFEEAFQITKEEDFNKVDLSIRGELPEGYYKQLILTFNPWSDKSWIKKRFFDIPNDNNKLAITTTYKCNEWLGDDDIRSYDEMRERNPRRYRIEGEGEWGVAEGLVFDNWHVEQFNPSTLDLPLWIGLDFGWKDPTAISFCRCDEKNKKLYLFQEYYHSQATLEQVADWLKDNGYAGSEIYCDSAEPRSIDNLIRLGIKRCKPAKKGPGSIMEGIRKLQEYDIIIHPSCENAIIEFSNYAFDKDKYDQWIDKPIDDWCHIIDSMRYGTQCGNRQSLKVIDKGALGL